MSSPYLVAAIGFSSLVALATIVSVSNISMNNSLLAQESMIIQTQKHQESLEMTISKNILNIQNIGINPSVLKEIRIFDEEGVVMLAKKSFPEPGLAIVPLGSSSYEPEEIPISDFESKIIIGITDLGNSFTATNLDRFEMPPSSNSNAMINGIGVNSRIIHTNYQGKLIYGYGVIGTANSLKPYNTLQAPVNFAAQILDSDQKTILAIPKFNSEYRYDRALNVLQQSGTTQPNVLSYSQSRTVGGSGTAMQSQEGIVFSGTGTVIVKLNDFGGQLLSFESNVPANAQLRLEEFNENDLMSTPYISSHGWSVWSSPYSSIHPSGHLHSGCGGSYTVSHSLSLQPNKPVSSQYSVKRLNGASVYTPAVTTISSGGQLKIQSVSETTNVGYCNYGLLCGDASCTWGWSEYNYPNTSPPHIPIPGIIHVFDSNPVNIVHITFGPNYHSTYTFPAGKQMYLVAKPNGNTFTIKATAFNAQTMPYLKITDLPENTPYEIVKDGFVSANGIAQSDGTVTLFLGDVNISGTNQGGTLYLYPQSAKYRGIFSTVVFDNLNQQTVYVPSQENVAYVTHAYVQIPITGNVTVTDMRLDNTPLPYLNGNYSTGERIRVPVIPGHQMINMIVNGIAISTAISDVLGGSGLKVIEPSTSTITKYDGDGTIPSISATTGAVAYVISTSDGTITTSITATISGSIQIENSAYFMAPPPVPPAPPPVDPLKAYVNTYKNGKFVSQQQIYFNANPVVANSGTMSGSSSTVVAKYTYPQTVINGVLTTSALTGDMIEFYVYANVHADGPIPPIPGGHTLTGHSGKGHATAIIHSGSILSS